MCRLWPAAERLQSPASGVVGMSMQVFPGFIEFSLHSVCSGALPAHSSVYFTLSVLTQCFQLFELLLLRDFCLGWEEQSNISWVPECVGLWAGKEAQTNTWLWLHRHHHHHMLASTKRKKKKKDNSCWNSQQGSKTNVWLTQLWINKSCLYSSLNLVTLMFCNIFRLSSYKIQNFPGFIHDV